MDKRLKCTLDLSNGNRLTFNKEAAKAFEQALLVGELREEGIFTGHTIDGRLVSIFMRHVVGIEWEEA